MTPEPLSLFRHHAHRPVRTAQRTRRVAPLLLALCASAAMPGAAHAVNCAIAPLLTPQSIACPVGTSCSVPIDLTTGGANIAALGGTLLLSPGLDCTADCALDASAPAGSCTTSAATCVFATFPSSQPPFPTIGDGSAMSIDVACTAAGHKLLSILDVGLGSPDGFPIEACALDAVVSCEDPALCSGVSCDDENPCTDDSCDAATGDCIFAPLPPAGGCADADNDGLEIGDDPCPVDPRNFCFGTVAVDAATGNAIRVNANTSTSECAGDKLDCSGVMWHGDFGFNQSPKSSTCNINGGGESCVISGIPALFGCDDETTEDLFQCEHSDRNPSPELIYTFDVPDGAYVVNMFFANTYDGSENIGDRTFDIKVEGELAYSAFDQVEAAGASAKAVVRAYVVIVDDGNGIEVELVNGPANNPAIKAIEILSAFAGGTTTTTTLPPSTTTTLPPSTTTTLPPSTTTTVPPPTTTTTTTTTTSSTTTTTIPTPGDNDNDGLENVDDPCPADPLNRCFGSVAVDGNTGNTIRLNANTSTAECAGDKTDCNGDLWLADFGYNQSAKASSCNLGGGGEACVISGITDMFGCDSESTEDLFQCEHVDRNPAPNLIYDFDVPAGLYVVNLLFANTYDGSANEGDRLTDIVVEGVIAYPAFDQVAAAGASGRAVVRSVLANVSGGLQIELVNRPENNPAIKAIEVLSAGGGVTTTTIEPPSTTTTTLPPTTTTTLPPTTTTTLPPTTTTTLPPTTTTTLPPTTTTTMSPVTTTTTIPTGPGDDDNDGLENAQDPCPGDARNACAGPLATDGTSGLDIRINANVSSNECGGTKTTCNAETWYADFGYNQAPKGSACNLGGGGEGCVLSGITELFGCENEETEDIFQCEHSDRKPAPHLIYSFDVPNGTYVINLYFANTYDGTQGVGERTMDIFAEGVLAYDDFDQVVAAGASARVVVRSMVVNVTDSDGLSFHLERVQQAPAVKGIEVRSLLP